MENQNKMEEKETKKLKNNLSSAVAVYLRISHMRLKYSHFSRTSFLPFSSSLAPQLSTIRAHIHAHLTAYARMYLVVYIYMLGTRGERIRSLSRELYKKKDGDDRATEIEEERNIEMEENGCENDVTQSEV